MGNNVNPDSLRIFVTSSNYIDNPNSAFIFNKYAYPLALGTSNLERMRIDANGNVGIGTTNPRAKLHVFGNAQIEAASAITTGSGAIIDFKRTLDNWNPARIEQLYSTAGSGYGGILTFQTNSAELNTLTERMRIDANGNVGIGITAPTAKLHIIDNMVTTGNSIYDSSVSLTSGTLAYLTANTTTALANQTILNIVNTGTNNAGGITSYGLQVSNTHTGNAPTNIAGIFTATGGTTNYGLRVSAMTGPTNYGLDIGALSGIVTNYGINIGAISAGSTTGYGINIGGISGGATAASIVTGSISATGTNAYQLSLGTITGANPTAHYGINLGNISGATTTNYGINIGTITGATTTNYGVLVGTITTTGATNSYGVYANTLTGTGNKYGFYSAGLTSSTASTNTGLYIGNISGSIGASTNTGIQIASIAGVATNAYGLNIGTITGATTANYGVNIGAITSTGATNSYGMYQAAMVGTGLSKYAFYSAGLTSTTLSTNNIGIYMGAISGSTAGTTNTGMQIGNISGVATNNYGINLGTLTGGTTGNYQLNLGAVTSVAAATNYGINVAGTTGAAVSSNNYGIKIASLTSSGTANYGLNIVQPAGAIHDAALEIGTVTSTTGDWALYAADAATPSFFAGNLGLGTTTPASLLHLQGGHITLGPLNASTAAEIRLREGWTNGTTYVAIKAPDNVGASSFTFTIPASYGTNGQVLSTNGSGILSWTPNSATGMANPMTAIGDMVYASVAGTPATPQKITIGTNGQCLVSNGTIPTWGTCSGTSVAAGGSTQIQFSNGLNFAASADFTWDDGIGAKTLGIGGTINGTKISIAARNASTGSSATNELRIGNDSAVDTLTLSVNSGANANGGDFAYIMNRRNAPLVIGTNSTERIRIMAGGNVGIGSTNPVAMLDVFGGGAFGMGTVGAPSIAFRTNLNTGMWSSGTNIINFSTNSLEIMRMDANGNVGIGTTLPSMLLDVGGTAWLRGAPLGQSGVYVKNDGNVGIGSTNPVALLDVFGGGAFGMGAEVAPSIAFRTNLNTGMWSSATNIINFSINGAEAMRMDANGNMGIGTLAPVGRLAVRGAGTGTGISFRTMDSTNADTFAILDNGNVGIGTSTPVGLFQVGAALNPSLFVTSAGNVGMGTTNPANKLQIVATSTPLADMVNISNAGFGVTTSGVSAIQISYVGGEAAIEASSIRSDITPGATNGGTWNAIRLVGNGAASGVSMNALKIDNLTAGPGAEAAVNIGTGWDFGVYSATTGNSYFAGNVGIGTPNPLSQFHIYSGASGANPSMLLAGNAGGETDFWLARVNNGDTIDNDTFQIGDGTIPGTNPYFAINSLGNVGIGTVNPATLLQLNGGHLTLGPLNASTAAEIRLQEGSINGTDYLAFKAPDNVGTSVTWTLPSSDGSTGQILQTSGGGVLSWTANSAAATNMANPMTTTGDLIYGSTTATPSSPQKLVIGSAGQCLIVSAGLLPSWGSCSAGASAAGAATQIQFKTGSSFDASPDFTWDNSLAGKTLGIGGTIAGAKISVALRNASAGATATNELRIGNDTAANTLSLLVNSSANSNGANNAYITNTQAGPLIFGTTNAERMRILAGGNIGIGTTNPGAMLEAVNNSIVSTKIVNIGSTGTGLTSGSLLYATSATTGLVATNGVVSFNATGNYTSTANVGLLSVVANTTIAGTIQNIQGNALTTGQALNISSTGTGLTTGSLFYATSATTGAVATNGIVSLNATGNYTSPANVGLLSLIANTTTAGTIQSIQGNGLTTGVALIIPHTSSIIANGGSLLRLSSTSADTSTTTGTLLDLSSSTSTAATQVLQTYGALTGGIGESIITNALTTGKAVNIGVGGTAALTTGNALLVTGPTGAAALSGAAGGVVNFTAAGLYTSTNNAGLLNLNANGTNAGIIENISGTNLTTGIALNIGVGATSPTTGNAILVTGPTGAAALSGAAGGVVNFTAAGNYTSTNNAGLLNLNANGTTAGFIQNISGTALTTGTALNVIASALTTGKAMSITAGGAAALTTGNALLVTGPSTTAALSTAAGGVVNFTAAGLYTSTNNAGLLNLNAGTATGVVQAITANGLTTGTALIVTTSSGTLASTSGLINIANTGASTSGILARFQSSSTVGSGLTILTSGNVGIGTTSPLRALHVTGSIRMGALIAGGGGAVAVYRDTNGDLADATSSILYKNNVENMEPVLSRIMELRAVRFDWNDLTSTPGMADFGMIAQEVDKVLPDLVTYNADGTPRGLKYEKMGVFALKGLQEQQVQIGDLQAQSLNLKTQNDSLNLKTEENISTVQGLQTAVNDKLIIISNSFASLDSRVTQNETDIQTMKISLANAETKLTEAENNLATFETGTNDTLAAMLETENMLTEKVLSHEDRIKALEDKLATMTVSGSGEIPTNVVMQDISGNVTLAGIFKAKNVQADGVSAGTVDTKTATVTNLDAKQSNSDESVSGLYSVKTGDIEASSLGEAEIAKVSSNENGSAIADGTGSDGKSVFVKTKAVSEKSQVFVTSKTMLDQPLVVTEVKPGEGFRVAIKNPSDENIKFAWWVVDNK